MKIMMRKSHQDTQVKKTTKALEEEETLKREVIKKGSSLETDHNRLHLGAKGKSTIIR